MRRDVFPVLLRFLPAIASGNTINLGLISFDDSSEKIVGGFRFGQFGK